MPPSGSYQRTKNSLRNSFVAVGFQLVSLLIGFWSRRIFLNHLGTEVLGLSTTAQSLLGFLNLAELGIGSAIAVTLYKPIFDNDRQSIKEIVALQGWLYRIVAFIVIGCSIILGFFFPSIFDKAELPLWYAYVSFAVFLYGSMLGYFANYKQIVLDAYQLNYKIQLSTKTIAIAKLVAQAFTVKYLDNGFLWWLGLEAAASTLMAIILSRTVNRTVPFIREKVEHPSLLRKKYPDVTVKVKQLFVHKIGGFVLRQSLPLIIYGLATLTVVAKYGNYILFTTNLSTILQAIFLGLASSVGNMIAENNKPLTMKVFRELYSSRFWMVSVCCICLWILVEPFISLWIGPEYILDKSTLALIILMFYISNTRNVIDVYINAYGLFRDVWSPIVESAISLGLSVFLGRRFGLDGILSGFIISELIIIKLWKPVFLFGWGLKVNLLYYVKLVSKHLVCLGILFYLMTYLASIINPSESDNFLSFFIYAIIIFVSSSLLLGIMLYILEPGFRNAFLRIKEAARNKPTK